MSAADETENLRAALRETLESLEEAIVILAEAGLRFPDAKVMNEEFTGESEFGYLDAAKMYENFAKTIRATFHLPALPPSTPQ